MTQEKNKTAVLSGATHGEGRKITVMLAKKGYDIVLLTHNVADAKSLATAVKATGRDCTYFPCRVEDDQSVATAFAKIFQAHGSIDLVFTNMGLMPDMPEYPSHSVAELTSTQWHDYLMSALMGVVNSTTQALRYMQKQGTGGRVINTAPFGTAPVPQHALYTTTRGAIASLTATINAEAKAAHVPISAHLAVVTPTTTLFAATVAALREK